MLLVFLVSLVGGTTFNVKADAITFTAGELLGKPTDTSITINIVPSAAIEYYYEYGTSPGVYTDQTTPVTAVGGQPSEVVITGLIPDTRYYYRMVYDGDGNVNDGDYEVRSEHTFQTQRTVGESFVFTVTSDSHGNFGTNTATNILSGSPDFNVDLGDTFMVDNGLAETQSAFNGRYQQWRGTSYFGGIGQSVPIYLAMGNHEEEEGWNLDDTPSRAVLNMEARKLYFPLPTNDGFYTGNTNTLALLGSDQLREDYYAWEWGDALFIVIDPFQYTMNLPYSPIAGEENDETIDGNQWSWTLGETQYNWLRQTLENSNAKYKFVFSHQMVGGVTTSGVSGGPGYVRGGAEAAGYFEWGGYNANGTWGFDTYRPGWGKPIHQLFTENGVSAYFHGHDHQYVYETRDGVVYQEVPSTSMTGSGFSGIYFEGDHTDYYGDYSTIEMLSSGGHLRISITPTVATVDYIAASGGGVNYSYTIEPSVVVDPDYFITATAGANGSISPSGEVGVVAGDNQSFAITPNTGYEVANVLVDGGSQGAITSYTFNNVQANHTISASFSALPQYTITASAGANGSISPSGAVNVTQGNNQAFTFVPNGGYQVANVLVDGGSQGAISNYTFNDVQTNHTISVSFDEAEASPLALEGTVSSGTADGTSSISVGHTTGTGTDRLMLVGISANDYSTGITVSSVNFTPTNGSPIPMTEVGAIENEAGRLAAIYSLVNPPSGVSGTMTVNFSEAIGYGIVVGVANFAGVYQADPLDDFVSAVGTEASAINVNVPTNPGDLVFDTIFLGAATLPTLSAGANQNQLWSATVDRARGAGSIEQASTTSTAMSWTASGGSTAYYWAIGAVPINPTPTGTTYNLTVAVDPAGSGTTNPAAGIHTYAEDSTVNVTATPATGFAFDYWSGACTGSGTCSVTMDANKNVTAHFAPVPVEVTFTGTELLGRPTDTSVSISVVPDANISLYYQYGTTSGAYTNTTSTVSATGGQPQMVTINSLTPNTKYYYRMQYSANGGSTWTPRPEKSFQTQRATGSTFTFDITSDSHIDIMLGNESNWTNTMNGVAGDNPDFLIDLGDTFAMDNGTTSVTLGDTAAAEQKYKDALPFFNIASGSSAIYIVPGNHEQQEAWHLQGTLANSLPVMGKNAEKKYFLNPVNNSFYSGDTSTYSYLSGDHLKQDYYAWEWGDALFVVISPFWTTTTKPYTTTVGGGETDATGSGDRWDWTLGLDQFNWLKSTLENSNTKYKFVFAHQIVGGNGMTSPNQVNYGHGGVDSANFVEWGGYNVDGTTYTWNTNRPGWGNQPIRQMMEANGVTAFFHGHDHQFAHESLNGMVYQAVPSGSFSGSFGNYTTGGNSGNTIWADSSEGPGHLKVTVGPTQTTVDFIRSNGTTAYTYNMAPTGEPSYTLTVAADPASGGSTNPAIGAHTYDPGTVVDITATPASGYVFDHWSGDCTGTGACQVTMDDDMSVTAHFTQIMYNLTVVANPAAGGTTNPTAGVHSYAEGTVVSVTATPASGYAFDHWSGACTGNGACQVMMNSDLSVTAHFMQIMHNLTVVVDPVGGGTTNPTVGVHPYAEGAVVSVTATPASGYMFDHWSGDCSGSGTCQVTMSADKSVTAHFVQITHQLTLAVEPVTSGTTNPTVGAHTYIQGTVVTVTATPSSGYMFDHWSGACSGSGACQVTMSADKSVTAHFTLIPSSYDLTIVVAPDVGGSTDPGAGVHNYAPGSVVDITPTANSGYEFDQWGGACTGTGACQVTMDANKTVTAYFDPITTPTLPSSFYGEIHIFDNPPSAGDTVEAYVSGVAYAVASATIATDASNLVYTIDVPGDDNVGPKEGGVTGDTVTFMIDGRVVATGTWYAGTNTPLNFHPPEALPGGPYTGIAGLAIDFAGAANDWAIDTLTYEWDWDNDGSYDESGQTPSHVWSSVGNYMVGLKVSDAQGGEGATTVEVVVDISTHSISLEAGWNLVSFNLHPVDTAIEEVLSSIDGNYNLVYAWDASGASSGSGNWLKYDPTAPVYQNTLSDLDETMGFWIYMLTADTLDVMGYQPGTTEIALTNDVGGWNLVGYPAMADLALPGALSDHGVNDEFSLVYAYHAADATDKWKLYDRTGAPYANDLLALAPGWGYWVRVNADNTWSVAYAAP